MVTQSDNLKVLSLLIPAKPSLSAWTKPALVGTSCSGQIRGSYQDLLQYCQQLARSGDLLNSPMTQKQVSPAPSSTSPAGKTTTMPSPPGQQLQQLLLLLFLHGWSFWILAAVRGGDLQGGEKPEDSGTCSVEISFMLMTFTLMWRTVVARKEMPLPILMYALFYYYLGTESTIFIGESVNIHLLHLCA